jgi:ATP-binding cassette subfamily B (MDR/TAP) protein 1
MKWELYTADQVLRAMFCIIFTSQAIGQVANFMPDAAKGKVAAVNIFALLDRVPKIDISKDGENRAASEGYASLQDVRFTYPTRPQQQILKGLNVEAKPGQTVALVGKSGCGKSTVMGLLERWYDPSEGSVKYDQLDTSKWNLKNLRSFMSIVGQEPGKI